MPKVLTATAVVRISVDVSNDDGTGYSYSRTSRTDLGPHPATEQPAKTAVAVLDAARKFTAAGPTGGRRE